MYTKENEHASLRDKNVTGRENVASLVSYLLKLSRLQPNGEVFEIWDKSYKVKKKYLLFFLKTS